MSRVFLASANVAVDPFPVYPLGMSVVARALTLAGHEVEQFDPLVDGLDALDGRLREFAPDVVGLSLRNIDNTDSLSGDRNWWVDLAREMTATIRGATAAPVLLGGSGFSLLPEAILDHVGADHGVVGEGERAAVDAVAALASGKPLPRLLRGHAPLSGGDFLPPLVEPRLLAHYLDRTGFMNAQTKRGCPHRCAYCTYPCLEGSRFRVQDPGEVVDHLASLQREHGVREVFFTDSVFNDAPGRYLELAQALLKAELDLKWCAFFRPAGMGRDELRLLKRAGLAAMELGTDAASDATLAALRKDFTFAEAAEVSRLAAEEGIPAAHYVIFGGPGETPETVEEGLANLASLERAVVFAFSGVRILPGTEVAARAAREGVLPEGAPLLRPVFYHSPGIEPEAMNRRIEEAFRGRRDRIFPPEAASSRRAVMQRFGHKGLLWPQLLGPASPKGVGRR